MDHSIIFARHLSRLVWLLLHEPANLEEQKAALRALVTVSRDGPVRLATREWQLEANGAPLPDSLAGVQELTAQMIGHAVRQLHVDAGASPADLLGVARILASEPVPGDGGVEALRRLRELAARTVRFAVGADPRPQRAASTPLGTPVIVPRSDRIAPDVSVEVELVDPEEAQAAVFERLRAELRTSGVRPAYVASSASEMMSAFAAVVASGDVAQLFAKLDEAESLDVKSRMLEEIVALAERASPEGKAMLVADILAGVALREAATPETSELRRVYGRAWRRLAKPTHLRQVAMLLPRKRGPIADYEAALIRAGEEGADVLIEQLVQATTAEDRRTYYKVLARLRAAIPALVHMLGDQRWYVVRNAADLLGELQAQEAERALIHHLNHADERVRRSSATALVRIGTAGALAAVQKLSRESSAPMRQIAASAFGYGREGRTVPMLVSALDRESDQEVQLAIVTSLARIGTPEAVHRLVGVAEPGGRFFNKKPTPVRVAAVQGLAQARTPAALASLTALTEDREREVRDAAARALAIRD